MPEEAWQKNDPEIEGWWNPIEVIGQTKIPVLAIFGEKDSQGDSIQGGYAWRKALVQAGNSSSRVEILPGADHLLGLSETGCMKETWQMMEKVWRDQGYESMDEILQAQGQYRPLSKRPYAPGYLDMIEEWLRDLRR